MLRVIRTKRLGCKIFARVEMADIDNEIENVFFDRVDDSQLYRPMR